ncbi:MAG: nucleotidyltransferase family protein [Methylococcales bacterium]|nr:nucleotidyltransferase family protein [Methylococcales bacterium]
MVPHKKYEMNHLAKLARSELKLAVLLSRPTMTAAQIEQVSELISIIDVTYFRELLEQHHICPCVYLNSKNHFVTLFPDDLHAYLHKKYQKNIRQSYQRFTTYGELLHLFKVADIPVRTLKGIPLAKKLYGDIVKRYSKDIDLIIPAYQINKANKKIMTLGYECNVYDQLSKNQQHLYLQSNKDVIYTRKTGIPLELHVRPCQYSTALSKNYTRQLFNSSSLEDKSNYEIIYLCWHGTQTFYHRLKWLLDIVLYIEYLKANDQLNIDSLVLLANELNSMRSLTVSWILANTLYETPVPAPILNFYHRDKVTRILVNKSLNFLNLSEKINTKRFRFDVYFYARLIPQGWADKRLLLMGIFTPNVDDIKLLSALPDKLFILHYIMRPLVFFYTRLRPNKS